MAVENFPIVIASSSPLASEYTTNFNVRNFRGARETRPNGIQMRWQSPARIASPIPFRVRGGDLTPAARVRPTDQGRFDYFDLAGSRPVPLQSAHFELVIFFAPN